MSFVFEISANHDQVERSARATKHDIIKNPRARVTKDDAAPAAAASLCSCIDLPAGGECGCCIGWCLSGGVFRSSAAGVRLHRPLLGGNSGGTRTGHLTPTSTRHVDIVVIMHEFLVGHGQLAVMIALSSTHKY